LAPRFAPGDYQAEYRRVQADGEVTCAGAAASSETPTNNRVAFTASCSTSRLGCWPSASDLLAGVVAQQARIFNTTLSSIDLPTSSTGMGGLTRIKRCSICGGWRWRMRSKNFFDLGYPAELAATLQRQIQHVFDSGEIVLDETPHTSPSGAAGCYEYIPAGAQGRPDD
jgi:hypothetical protein